MCCVLLDYALMVPGVFALSCLISSASGAVSTLGLPQQCPTPLPPSNKSSIHPSPLPYPPCKYSPAFSTHWHKIPLWRGSWLVETWVPPSQPSPSCLGINVWMDPGSANNASALREVQVPSGGTQGTEKRIPPGRLQGGGGLRAGP